MIVASAGHIDHGKTQLVRTLTGTDTDRLPDEKARGISIDLGFAYLPLEAGGEIGFVDVPGHERFIHNMLAGVAGIDLALLVVAADDGVMPQTVEHLQIIDLLGIRRGIGVVTKADRVDAGRVDAVKAQLANHLRGTTLSGAAILAVSTVTGQGIDALRAALAAAAREHRELRHEGQLFRLAVDRAFSVAGSGTVVTGTVFNGEVRRGESLVVSPPGAAVRVRGLHVHGRPVDQARAGMRCALNLTGIEPGAAHRGHWVLHESLHSPTARLDVRLRVPGNAASVAHWTSVHVHLGTAETMGRVAIARAGSLAPGASGLAQLVLERPIAALHGDRFIVRAQDASRTLAGGIVLDPFTVPRRRGARAIELTALGFDEPGKVLAELLAIPRHAVDSTRFETMFCLSRQTAMQYYRDQQALCIGRQPRVVLRSEIVADLRNVVRERIAAFHASEPRAPGMRVERLHADVASWLPADPFSFVLRGLIEGNALQFDGGFVRAVGFDPTSNAADEALWEQVQRALLEAGPVAPVVSVVSNRLAVDERTLVDLLHRKARSGVAFQISPKRFYLRETLAVLAANAALVARSASRGLFGVAQYRDATGISRGVAIEILECLDALGVTQRVGDLRRMNKNFVPILGPAKPRLVRSVQGASSARHDIRHSTPAKRRNDAITRGRVDAADSEGAD